MQSSTSEPQSEVEQSGDESLTPPRPKKSKSVHVGAAHYKCKYNSVGQKSFLSLLQCRVIHIGKH